MALIPSISVVVLSYNRPDFLKQSLASVWNQSIPVSEVILVDNPSPQSKSIQAIANGYEGLHLVQCETNLGFTGGMNCGLKLAKSDVVIVTEDDIILAFDTVERLVDSLYSASVSGFVAPVMYNVDSGTVRCAGGEFELGTWPKLTVYGTNEVDTGRYDVDREVGYIPGACIAAKKSTWTSVGFFPERYFMYMEDIDLCLTATRMGLAVRVAGKARVRHFDPPNTGNTPDWLLRQKLLNTLRLYGRHAPLGMIPFFLLRYAWSNIIKPFPFRFSQRWAAASALLTASSELWLLARERRSLPSCRQV